jgi:hypothetical protein
MSKLAIMGTIEVAPGADLDLGVGHTRIVFLLCQRRRDRDDRNGCENHPQR